MSQNCFEQVKRFFYIGGKKTYQLPQERFFEKLDPLASKFQHQWELSVMPASYFSIDKMIIWFTGRLSHTYLIKNKPIPVGYKLHALYDAKYCWTWIWDSLYIKSSLPPEQADFEFSDTSKQVLALAFQLSWQACPQYFHIFINNAYTSIGALCILWKYEIAASNTARSNQKNYPRKHQKINCEKNQ